MRHFVVGSALALLAPSVAVAQGGTDAGSFSGTAAAARAHATADSLRRKILSLSSFAGFGSPECNSGELRTFENDTRNESKPTLAALEKLVISYGAFESLNSDAGRALLRAVTRLEIGGPGPRWDTMTGDGPRSFNPILPVNKATSECLLTAGTKPDGLVLPAVTNFVPPRDSGAYTDVPVQIGPNALALLKSAYNRAHPNDPKAVMHHSRVNAYAMWDDYAIVSVLRQADLRGVTPVPKEETGAVYAFHRVGAEWRLIALVRSW